MYDLIVIGAGPGGYVAAIRGAQLGLKVALIEKDLALGGACLHRGCIPSKAYLAAAEMVEIARKAAKIGITFAPPRIDFEKLVSSKDEKLKKLSKGISELVKANKIDAVTGEASLEAPGKVRVGDRVLETRFVILATGTEPVRPSSFSFDGKSVLTTDELFKLTALPKRLLVVGGGVIGCEMACAFNLLGSEVTLMEQLPEILATEDRLAVKGLRSVLEKRGVKILTGVSAANDGSFGNDGDCVLVAVGRRVSPEEQDKLGLSKLGIQTEKGFVKVSGRLETSVEGIYAIGDLIGTTLLAHGAMAEGLCAVENIAGEPREMDYSAVPRVVYTIPEIASVGAREEDLKKGGVAYRTGRFSYLANAMALCHEEDEGFAAVLVGTDGDAKDRVLGATVFGAHAADMIQEVALVIRNGLSVQALMETIHAHPTLNEIVHEASEDALGLAIHKSGRSPGRSPGHSR